MARRRSGARAFLVLGLVLVLLAVALVVADRIAASRAEDRIAADLQRELGTPGRPSVGIGGFPFLTQVAVGKLRDVHVVGDEVTSPGPPAVTARHVDLHLRDVTSPDRFRTGTARRVDGTATLDLAALPALTGQPVRYVGNGRVEVVKQTTAMGVSVEAKVTGRPSVNPADQTVSLDDPQLSLGGVAVPGAAAQPLLDSVVKPSPITGVPLGLKVNQLQVDDSGVHVGLSGENVALPR